MAKISDCPLIFMAQPNLLTRALMLNSFESTGRRVQLGSAIFHIENWHQSFAGRFDDDTEIIERLLQAGDSIERNSFVLTLNRLRGRGGSGEIHWELCSTKKSDGLTLLLQSFRAALIAQDFEGVSGHTPHVTISYRAPAAIPTMPIPPIDWKIDEFLLVRGGGKPYRYEVIKRWPLIDGPGSSGEQLGLL